MQAFIELSDRHCERSEAICSFNKDCFVPRNDDTFYKILIRSNIKIPATC